MAWLEFISEMRIEKEKEKIVRSRKETKSKPYGCTTGHEETVKGRKLAGYLFAQPVFKIANL